MDFAIQCRHCGDVFSPEVFYGHVRGIVENYPRAQLIELLEQLLDRSWPGR